MISFAVLALSAGLAAAPPANSPIEISGVGHKRSIACEGRDVTVDGVDHVLTFTGACASLTLSGSGSKVVIDLKPGAMVEVNGTDQTVQWRSSRPPRVNISGVDNNVGKAP
ncbi:DUF3060 domain-containing protein [Caulobacter segnis]|uniref:DUF3060 domain-containing protein n=1 Tax=Caulobacter segnis TaxID=88688 RepID=UPI002856C03D|nr:DUF3060 domain-containing protein [Caulobacter segnis]MDR6627623.1 uncharacterized protein YabE (DUF348 family) [Caulobacter segnis]